MKKFIIAVASLLLFSSVCLAQKKDPPKPAATTTAAPAAKPAPDAVPSPDKDTVIEILKLQKEQANLQMQFNHDQQEIGQIQQQYQKDAQEIVGLKLKAEAAEKGKYALDLATLTYKPNPAPKEAPKKN